MRRTGWMGRCLLSWLRPLSFDGHRPARGVAAWQPTKPVEFVIPAGTGGGADSDARFVTAIIQKENLAPATFLP